MCQRQELDLHKNTWILSDGQKHTLQPEILFPTLVSARKCEYHFFNLPSHAIVCTIQACLDPREFGIASKLPSMRADHI